MAGALHAGHVGPSIPLQIRSQPQGAAMALGQLGGVVAAIMWLAASVLFSWYVANFGSYNKTYGSLGAIIGFMTLIWISITVVLLGPKFDAEMGHQTTRDTTKGQPKPLGMRGARM